MTGGGAGGVGSGLGVVAVAALCAFAGCGGGTLSPSAGTCSAAVPAGQACNALTAAGPGITPTCASGSLPVGEGGTIVDGTYVMTRLTYYGTDCSTTPVSETIQVAGGCIQVASSGPVSLTESATYAVAGNVLSLTRTCFNAGAAVSTSTQDVSQTFTATATGFTIFNQQPTTDGGVAGDVAVFTRPLAK